MDIHVGRVWTRAVFVGSRLKASARCAQFRTNHQFRMRHIVCSAGRIVVSRVAASLLILIVALPFTAPFSTCDIADLMSRPSNEASRMAIGSDMPAAAIEGATTQTTSASVLEEEQFKDAILSPVASAAVTAVRSTAAAAASVHAFLLRIPLIALRL